MPIIVPKGNQEVDLLRINEGTLKLLDTFTEDERFDAIQYLLDHYMDLEIHNVIEHLAKTSFKSNGIHFLSHCVFLAELIREYVDKHDGMRLTMTYAARKDSGLKHYKFSLHSTYIFNELFTIVESSSSNGPDYVAIFARSLAMNIWLPILTSRSQDLTFSPLTSEQSETLVHSIFSNNLNVEQAYITCFETSQGSRYLVKDFSHPWLKSTRQRAKLKSRDRPASGTLPWTGKRMPTTMALRLQKDLLRIPSGCLRKSQPIAVSSPRLSASMARSIGVSK